MILRQKIIFFPILGGGGGVRPPGSAPEYHYTFYNRYSQSLILIILSIALIHFLHCIFNRIDTFATWSEDLEVRLNAKAYSNKQVIGIMERLAVYRHNTGRVRRLLFNPLPPPPPPPPPINKKQTNKQTNTHTNTTLNNPPPQKKTSAKTALPPKNK